MLRSITVSITKGATWSPFCTGRTRKDVTTAVGDIGLAVSASSLTTAFVKADGVGASGFGAREILILVRRRDSTSDMKDSVRFSRRASGRDSSSKRLRFSLRARYDAAASTGEVEGFDRRDESLLCFSIKQGTAQQSASSETLGEMRRGRALASERHAGVTPFVVNALDKRDAKLSRTMASELD